MAALALPSLAAALLMTSPALSAPPLVAFEGGVGRPGTCESMAEEERLQRLVEGMPPSWQPAAAPDDSVNDIWASRCGSCHGIDGSAKTFMGRKEHARAFTDPQFQDCRTDGDLRAAIVRGMAGSKMRSFGSHLTAAQVEGLIHLVREFDARKPGEPVAYAK
jgi:hypothetical protein